MVELCKHVYDSNKDEKNLIQTLLFISIKSNRNNNPKHFRQDSMLSTGSLNSSMVSEPGSFSEATSPYRKYVEKHLKV